MVLGVSSIRYWSVSKQCKYPLISRGLTQIRCTSSGPLPNKLRVDPYGIPQLYSSREAAEFPAPQCWGPYVVRDEEGMGRPVTISPGQPLKRKRHGKITPELILDGMDEGDKVESGFEGSQGVCSTVRYFTC